MTKRTQRSLTRLSALSVIFAAGLAIAAPPSAPPGAPPTDAPLRGPRVDDRDVPGHSANFGEMDDKRMRAARVPMRVFIGAIHMLATDEAPEGLRLTAEQDEQIKAIGEELREATRALARERERGGAARGDGEQPERGARNRAPRPDAAEGSDGAPPARDRARPNRRGPGGPGAQGDEMVPEGNPPQRRRAGRPAPDQVAPEDMADREVMRREMAQRMMDFEPPQEIEALRVRAWEVLTEPQQEFVRAEIDRKMEEIRAEREARRDGREGVEPGAAPQGAPGERRMRDRMGQVSPEEILKRIEQLPPERRERALERFRRYLEEQESADKPAPDMDEVDVPTP
ncbi:MAG: hypothetical protein KDA30_12350 [Phycisphaerales bacterium]|nr:hypothetical protein [Phycisphaerales bacterium]